MRLLFVALALTASARAQDADCSLPVTPERARAEVAFLLTGGAGTPWVAVLDSLVRAHAPFGLDAVDSTRAEPLDDPALCRDLLDRFGYTEPSEITDRWFGLMRVPVQEGAELVALVYEPSPAYRAERQRAFDEARAQGQLHISMWCSGSGVRWHVRRGDTTTALFQTR